MNNTVSRRLKFNTSSGTLTIDEKRPFRINEIKILTDATTRKQTKLTAKHDGATTSFETSANFDGSYVFNQLDEVTFIKESIITVWVSQAASISGQFDQIKIYAEVEYLDNILEYVLDEAKEGLIITTV